MKNYTSDDIIFFVTAANIAGYLECEGEIMIDNDAELADFIGRKYDEYNVSTDFPVWEEFIEAALVREYEQEEKP